MASHRECLSILQQARALHPSHPLSLFLLRPCTAYSTEARLLVELKAVTWGLRGLFGVRGKAGRVAGSCRSSVAWLGAASFSGGSWRLLLPSGSVP